MRRHAAVLAFSGALLGIGFWPGPWGWLALGAVAPLLWFAHGAPRASAAFWGGWFYGTVTWIVGMYWFAGTIAKFLRVPGIVAWILFIALCAMHGLMFAALAGAFRWSLPRLRRRYGWGLGPAAALCAAPLFLLIEAYFPMVFPAHWADALSFHLPAVQSVDIFGKSVVAFWVAVFNAGAWIAWSGRGAAPARWGLLAFAVAGLGLNELYGFWRIADIDAAMKRLREEGRTVKIGIVQGAIPTWQKRNPESLRKNLDIHNGLTGRLLEKGPLDLVIWPETVYGRRLRYERLDGPLDELQLDKQPAGQALRSDVPFPVTVLLSVIGLESSRGRRYNTAFLKGPDGGVLGKVEKRYRMPFGEFIPLGGLFPSLYKLSPRTRRVWPGERQRLLVAPGGARLGVLVCYEDVIADYARKFVVLGADLLVNLTNDAWFGHGKGPVQHLRMSSLRAIENRRYLLRAVNTGVTAVVDPVGRVTHRLPSAAPGVLRAEVELSDLSTAYHSVGRWPYRIALLAALLLVLLAGGRLTPSGGADTLRNRTHG